MSTTSVLIIAFALEQEAMDFLGAKLSGDPVVHYIKFQDMQIASSGRWYAGNRLFEGYVYPGAFKELDLDQFIELMQVAPWLEPANVQLFVKQPGEVAFKEIQWLTETTAGFASTSEKEEHAVAQSAPAMEMKVTKQPEPGGKGRPVIPPGMRK